MEDKPVREVAPVRFFDDRDPVSDIDADLRAKDPDSGYVTSKNDQRLRNPVAGQPGEPVKPLPAPGQVPDPGDAALGGDTPGDESSFRNEAGKD